LRDLNKIISTTITAAVSRIPGQPFSLETLELEDPRDNEVLVRIVATGICHSDVHMRNAPDRVPKPIVLGHEGAGGGRKYWKVGKESATRRSRGDYIRLMRRVPMAPPH
jgi:Zn-dependent alcohol dehydrogenase